MNKFVLEWKMAFNQVENSFLSYGIELLEGQYRKAHPDFRGHFGLGSGVTLMIIPDGEDAGKLTVGVQLNKRPWEYVPDPRIKPVDCYNLMDPEVDMATNVRFFDEYLESRTRISFHDFLAEKRAA